MDSLGSNRPPPRSLAAPRSRVLLRPSHHLALGDRVAASKLGMASGFCGVEGCFGNVQQFDAVQSTTARAQSGSAGGSATETMECTGPGTKIPLKYSSGKAFPLGVSQVESGLNFCIFSQHASSVILCLKLDERIHDHKSGGDIYLAFNAHSYFIDAVIPPLPHHECWNRVISKGKIFYRLGKLVVKCLDNSITEVLYCYIGQ